jgi:1-aminocyclopropane-1-carboxylate deaminase/D-cysteine desulfhydrase-like pyridoxal-dependent ACC family enzyme
MEARQQQKNTLLTFGGAYSNHIYATAAAGKLFDFKTVGIIRGEETLPLNPILSFAKENNMELYYVSREIYKKTRELTIDNYSNIEQITQIFPFIDSNKTYYIPEGGSNSLAIKGCLEISQNLDNQYDVICCACGTGSTLAGIVVGCPSPNIQKIGFAVLKGGDFLRQNVENLIADYLPNSTQENRFSLQTAYHFGGYAKTKTELLNFISKFHENYTIPIEPVYTGKMFYGLFDLISKGYFKPNTKILAIHTGGVYE